MIEPGPHIFFSPHADDVVLSCGGTIHSLASERRPVEVIGVFAGIPSTRRYSAYARQLHAKWHLSVNAIEERWGEDTEAMRQVGVTAFEHWDYLEAPYRTTTNGKPLYATNEDLTGAVSNEDQKLRTEISRRVHGLLERSGNTVVSYFPLSLGHVDHQILFAIGLEMRASESKCVLRRLSYVETYELTATKWQPGSCRLSSAQNSGGKRYTSQLRAWAAQLRSWKAIKCFSDSVGMDMPASVTGVYRLRQQRNAGSPGTGQSSVR